MASPPEPIFIGHVATTKDALLLFEACLLGVLQPLTRRPLDRERPSLIKSGNVFIYSESTSGIKRWTDGLVWSPSRALTNFLIYRELDGQVSQREKKQVKKSKKTKSPRSPRTKSSSSSFSEDMQKSLVGSLVDSYSFQDGGLVKKTISVVIAGIAHHLVSYYSVADAMSQQLPTPAMDTRLKDLNIRPELLGQEFNISLQEEKAMPTLRTSFSFTQSNYDYQRTPQGYSSYPNEVVPLPTPWTSNNIYELPSQGSYSPKSSIPAYTAGPWNTVSYVEVNVAPSYNVTTPGVGYYSTNIPNVYGTSPAQQTPAPWTSGPVDYRQPPYNLSLSLSIESECGPGSFSAGSFSDSSSPENQVPPASTGAFASHPTNFDPNGFQYFQAGSFR